MVLHFRTPEKTLACLHSLMAEGIAEVVLVDNSEDGGRSLSSMRPSLDQLEKAGLAVRLVTSERNLGFAAGVQAGRSYLGHDPRDILLINSDACLEAGSLAAMRDSLSGAALCVVPLRRKRPDSPPVSSIVFYHRLFALYLPRATFGAMPYPSGCCMLMRSDGPLSPWFDPDFFFYGEDVQLGNVLATRGLTVVECPKAVVLHAGSASSKNGSLFYEYHMTRGHWLLAGKLARNPLEHGAFLMGRCLALVSRAAVRSVRFRSSTPWQGLMMSTLDVLKGRRRRVTPQA